MVLGAERREPEDILEGYARGDTGAYVGGEGQVVAPSLADPPAPLRVHTFETSGGAGSSFACGIDDDGNVGCLGATGTGKLGNELTATNKDGWRRVHLYGVPDANGVSDVPSDKVLDVCVGEDHACAISNYVDERELFCWGSNLYGQLGYNKSVENIGLTTHPAEFDPVFVKSGPAIQVVCGLYHTCVLLEGRVNVLCWGKGNVGQLGFVSTDGFAVYNASQSQGLSVGLESPIVFLSAGTDHTCATLETGEIRCWGEGAQGRLGTGNAADVGTEEDPFDTSELPVDLGSPVVVLDAGPSSTCAVLDDNSTLCFGRQVSGSMAAGTQSERYDDSPPVAPGFFVPSRGKVTGVATTIQASCVVDECSCVFCAGRGSYLGSGREYGVGGTPWGVRYVHFHFPHKVESITTWGEHHCVTYEATDDADDRLVSCWGRDTDGRLGTEGGANFFPTVHRVRGTAIAPAAIHVVASFSPEAAARGTESGSGGGYLINATHTALPLPPPMSLPPTLSSVRAGKDHTCFHIGTAVHCIGGNGQGQLYSDVAARRNATLDESKLDLPIQVHAVATGRRVTCFILSETKEVACIGANANGELGLGSTDPDKNLPGNPLLTVSGLGAPATDICLGNGHGCAIIGTTKIQCWGQNNVMQLGGPTLEDSVDPDSEGSVGPLFNLEKPLSSLACGAHHTCVIVDSTPRCWGWNVHGQLGHSVAGATTLNETVPLTMLEGAQHIAAGYAHTCAVDKNGVVFCFGSGNFGDLGTGSVADSAVPTAVPLDGLNAVAVSLGTAVSCALVDNGDVACWGTIEHGDVRQPSEFRPTRVSGTTDITCDPTHPLPAPLDVPDVVLPLDENDSLYGISNLGDLHGDGVDDILLRFLGNGTYVKVLSDLASAVSNSSTTSPLDTAVTIYYPTALYLHIASIGDIDGDGDGDVLVYWMDEVSGNLYMATVRGGYLVGGKQPYLLPTPTKSVYLSEFDEDVLLEDGVLLVGAAGEVPATPVLSSGPPIMLRSDGGPDVVFGTHTPPQLFIGLDGGDAQWEVIPTIDVGGETDQLVSIVSVGDVSGDGIGDLALIVGTGEDVRATHSRVLVLLFGNNNIDEVSYETLVEAVAGATRIATLYPDPTESLDDLPVYLVWRLPELGKVVPLGDVDGDGAADLWLEVLGEEASDAGDKFTRGGILLYGGAGMVQGYGALHNSWSPFARRFFWRTDKNSESDVSQSDSHVWPVGDLDGDGRADLALITGAGSNLDVPLASEGLDERVLLLSQDVWSLHNWYDTSAGEVWDERDTEPVQVLGRRAKFVISLGRADTTLSEDSRVIMTGRAHELVFTVVKPSVAVLPTTTAAVSTTSSVDTTTQVIGEPPGTSSPATEESQSSDSTALLIGLVAGALLLVSAGVVVFLLRRRRRDSAVVPMTKGTLEAASVRAGPAPRSVSRSRSRQASISGRRSVSHVSRGGNSMGTADSTEMDRNLPLSARYDQIPVAPVQRTAYGETSLTDGSSGGTMPLYGETSLYTPTVYM
jgi:alpha-tubulin suppressor-like RCC1 family protein